MMKKIAAAAMAALLCVGQAWAHGGGTDSTGCHNDHKTGGYHCH